MEYLKALCDAEDGIYACNEAIDELEYEMQSYWEKNNTSPYNIILKPGERREPTRNMPRRYKRVVFEMPREPMKPGYPYVGKPKYREPIPYVVCSTIVGGLLGFLITVASLDLAPCFFLFLLAGFIFGWIIPVIMTNNEKAELKEKADRDYQQSMERYEQQLSEYKQKMEYREYCIAEEEKAWQAACQEAREVIGQMIDENKATRQKLTEAREKLYDKNIIHVSFRNQVAVHQIYEYLDMGVCDALEGAQGAYSQYLQDLRVNRICASINDLKNSLVNALSEFSSTQRRLISEMRAVNSNIGALKSSIEYGFSSVSADIVGGFERVNQRIKSGNDSLQTAQAQMNVMQDSLNKIKSNVNAAAHNEYIALREANLNQFLLKNPDFLQ